jgi:hypothetical protein
LCARASVTPELERKVCADLIKDTGINKTAKPIGVGNSTVDKIAHETSEPVQPTEYKAGKRG